MRKHLGVGGGDRGSFKKNVWQVHLPQTFEPVCMSADDPGEKFSSDRLSIGNQFFCSFDRRMALEV